MPRPSSRTPLALGWEAVRRALTWQHYRDQIAPTLLATWVVWIPLMAIIYSLPLALQFPLFSLALTFWVLRGRLGSIAPTCEM